MSSPAIKLEPNELEENQVRRQARINRPRWEPKKWHPVYEEVVLLSALGYSNIDIAKQKGFTTVHVSNILCTQQAKTLMEMISIRLRHKTGESMEDRLERYAEKAMQRVEEVLNDDEYAMRSPGGIFDRAITVLKVTNKVKSEGSTTVNNNLVVPVEAMLELKKGMELSDKARSMNKLVPIASIDTTK